MVNITKKLDLPFVPHGLRGSFADWASDHKNKEYKMLAKLSIAHVVDNQSDQAYFTKDPIHKRRAMLQEYSYFLAQTCGPFISPMDQDQIPTTWPAWKKLSSMQYQVRTSKQGNQKMERLLPLLGELQNAAIQPKRWPR